MEKDSVSIGDDMTFEQARAIDGLVVGCTCCDLSTSDNWLGYEEELAMSRCREEDCRERSSSDSFGVGDDTPMEFELNDNKLEALDEWVENDSPVGQVKVTASMGAE